MNLRLTIRQKQIILLVFLIAITVLIRLQNTHQTDFDSYWLHGMAESIQIHEGAPWVYHPASLFGYYPLSYPSGTSFFLAMFSSLTGLDMNTTVFLSSILVGLLIVLGTFVVAHRLFDNWNLSFFAALIVSLSPIVINYTAFNAGGRVFIMPFYLLFIWSLVQLYHTPSLKYTFLALFSFIFSFLIHRTAIFLFIFIIAFLGAWFFMSIPKMWLYVKNHKHFKNHIIPRYEKNRYYLLFDLLLLFGLLFLVKMTDLIVRNRFSYHLDRMVIQPSSSMFSFFMSHLAILTIIGLIAIISIVGLFFYFKHKKNIHLHHLVKKRVHFHYHDLFENPQKYFVLVIGLFGVYVFVRQFFGGSFYAPSINEFDTVLLSGDSPLILFGNVFINYSSSITPLFIFFLASFIFLLIKKNKTFIHWFLIFSFIGFCGVLLDKRYIRLFITPFIAILSSYAIFEVYRYLHSFFDRRRFLRFLRSFSFFILVLLVIAGAFIPMMRMQVDTTKTSGFSDVEMYWQTGQYLRLINDGNFSTITTDELQAGVIIFASSGVPGGSHNVYYFVDEERLQPEPLDIQTVKYKLLSGEKIQNLWILPDWIFGGQYYVGRHARYLFDRPFTDQTNQIIIDDYNERFYIHDKTLDKNTFLRSLEPVKNKIYDTPKTEIYTIEEGRE